MPHQLPIDRFGFIRFSDVRAQGRQNELRAAVARGELESARRGLYRATRPAADTVGAGPGNARAHALAYLSDVQAVAIAFAAPIFTSYSAAALLGLPVIGRWPAEVFVLSRDAHGRRRAGVVEVARTCQVEVRTVDGLAVTSVEHTLVQLARHAPLIAALAATDAALHVPRSGRPPLTTPELLRAEHERLKPYPRSRRVDAVLERLTTLAETPLETGSRLLIEETGFAVPELQHELWLPELGRNAYLDFFWPSVGVGAEADGRGKYLGDATALDARRPSDGSTFGTSDVARRAADAVIAEKDRENAIRRQLRGFDRWDWNDMLRRHPVEARLTRLGVPRVRRPVKLT
ncbi:hypothetical protein [Agromyces sp. Marseille-Q5079]|uniref:hypothetical protein n=1 Tax=Agromyces sp. Marseille-Q5079 TaxID=3439059 RepID=UPI003D9CAA15